MRLKNIFRLETALINGAPTVNVFSILQIKDEIILDWLMKRVLRYTMEMFEKLVFQNNIPEYFVGIFRYFF